MSKKKYATNAERQKAWRIKHGQKRRLPAELRKQKSAILKAEWKKTEKGRAVVYRSTRTKGFKVSQKKYQQSEKGRATYGRYWCSQKCGLVSAKRQRDLGFHPISFPLTVPFDWHHVNKNDVVAIVRGIHRAVRHRCGDGKLEGVVG